MSEALTNHKEHVAAEEKRQSVYEANLSRIEALLSEDNEAVKTYIAERVASLDQHDERGEVSHLGKSVHKGFIGAETAIRRHIMVEPFHVDDPSLYETFFETLRQFKAQEGWKDLPTKKIIPNVIQWSLTRYFGNVASGSGTEQANRAFYMERSVNDAEPISLSEFKGKRIAVCAEKAAAAQNVLAFVGLESDLVASANCRLSSDGEPEGHYYNVIHAAEGDMIYDPTNPKLTYDAEGTLINYQPALYPIDAEQAEALRQGGEVQVTHDDLTKEGSGTSAKVLSERVYAGPTISKV